MADNQELCSCLDNKAQIDSVVSNQEQISSQINQSEQIMSDMNNIVTVLIKYTTIPSDNIDLEIDNTNKTITANIKQIQFDSANDFPVTGSEKLIYVDKTANVPYRWDKETSSYKSLGKDLTKEFEALEKEIEGVKESSIKDILVNNETSVGKDKISNINVQLLHDQDNEQLYYLQVNDKRAGEINIPKDQFLKSVTYNPNTHILTFVWETTTGEQTTTIDISDLIDVYTAGDGLELNNNIFSIKVDPNSSGMLTVSENGINLQLEPATEKTFGTVRAWIEDDYIHISTEPWVAFVNVKTDSTVIIQGSQDVVQEQNTLVIN